MHNINRICSLDNDVKIHRNSLLKGITLNLLLKNKQKKVYFSKQGQKSKKVEKGLPFVVTYHSLLYNT